MITRSRLLLSLIGLVGLTSSALAQTAPAAPSSAPTKLTPAQSAQREEGKQWEKATPEQREQMLEQQRQKIEAMANDVPPDVRRQIDQRRQWQQEAIDQATSTSPTTATATPTTGK